MGSASLFRLAVCAAFLWVAAREGRVIEYHVS